jgi:hypothetical protein
LATLELYQAFQVTIGGELLIGGSRSAPQEIDVGDEFDRPRKTLAAGDIWDLWTADDSAVDAMGFLWVESDVDGVQLEFTVDLNNGVGLGVFAIVLVANIPLILPTKQAIANYAANFATGTVDSIERIRVKNPADATDDANVRGFILSEAEA